MKFPGLFKRDPHSTEGGHGERKLADLQPGERGRILAIGGEEDFRIRLMELGLTEGKIVELDKLAPLQDPMEIIVGSYHLSLRRAEARWIRVDPVIQG